MGLDCVCMWGGLWTVHMCQTWNLKYGALVSTVLSMDGGWPSELSAVGCQHWSSMDACVVVAVMWSLYCDACFVSVVLLLGKAGVMSHNAYHHLSHDLCDYTATIQL